MLPFLTKIIVLLAVFFLALNKNPVQLMFAIGQLGFVVDEKIRCEERLLAGI